jgi:hypothetical protein
MTRSVELRLCQTLSAQPRIPFSSCTTAKLTDFGPSDKTLVVMDLEANLGLEVAHAYQSDLYDVKSALLFPRHAPRLFCAARQSQ